MAKKYKYRYRETYNGHDIDIKYDKPAEFAKKLQKIKAQIDRETISRRMKLKDFVNLYMETYKKNSVSESWYTDLTAIGDKIITGIGNKPTGAIKPIEVQNFLNTCSHYSESYVKKIYDLTAQIFRYAYRNGVTDTDYTLTLERPRGVKGESRRAITNKEREVLLKVLDGHRGELFCKLMLYCGLRPGEVRALQWKDIDFEQETLLVSKGKKKNEKIGDPKSKAGIRAVPIPHHLMPLLEAHKSGLSDYVCTQTDGKSPHTETSRKKMWNNICREMNIEMGCAVFRNQLVPPYPLADDFTMYNLRHTYCTDLEKAGVPITIAARLMGHSDISITAKIYTHATQESLGIARNLINSTL